MISEDGTLDGGVGGGERLAEGDGNGVGGGWLDGRCFFKRIYY